MSGWVIIDQSTYRELVSVFKSKMHRSLGSGSAPAQASKERKYCKSVSPWSTFTAAAAEFFTISGGKQFFYVV